MWAWLFGAAIVSVLGALLALHAAPRSAYPDSAFYVRHAFELSGLDAPDAARAAATLLCDGDRVGLDLTTEKCEAHVTGQLASASPTYVSIFESRPGYPALLAVGFRLWGTSSAVPLTVGVAALAGWTLSLLVWRVTARAWVAPVSALVWFATPAGGWTTALLTEGLALFFGFVMTACTWGVWAAATTRRRTAWAFGLVVATAGLGATKSSTGVVTCLTLALMVGVAALVVPGWRTGRTLVTGLVLGALAITTMAVGAVLGWAGLSVTLEDVVTRHFTRPAPPRVWASFVRLLPNALQNLWRQEVVARWWLWLLTALGASLVSWWGARRPERGAWLLLGAALPGLVVVLVHPIGSEAGRLALPWYLTVPAGAAVLLAVLAGRDRLDGRVPASPSPGTGVGTDDPSRAPL